LPDTSQNGEVKIVIDQATKYYDTKTGKLHALERFSAQIRQGELVCILGPSGCGKTTLLWAMSGLHALSAGTLTNKFIADANQFDKAKVASDAQSYPVSADWKNIKLQGPI
jgi:ABC-type Fe3+/spermidine/putrescine transport system ATPase subunit